MRARGWALALLCLSLLRPAPLRAADAKVVLPGHVPRQIRTATIIGRAPADEPVSLSLVVRVDQALLDQTLSQIYGTSAKAKRNYMNPAGFAQKFGLAEKRQALIDFAQANGLSVDPAENRPESLIVNVTGPSAAVEQAFGIQLNHYRGADGQVFRAHETEPTIPASLSAHLTAVVGLSNIQGLIHPHIRMAPTSGQKAAGQASSAAPSSLLGGMNGPCANLSIGCGLAPSDIQSVYGLSGGLNGAGQTVAIVELDGYNPADILAYETQFGISPPPDVAFVSVNGAPANKCGSGLAQSCDATTFGSDGGMGEVALDIELVLALLPGANQLEVYTSFNSLAHLLNIYSKIEIDDIAETVTTSWGVSEDDAGSAFMNAENAIFAMMAADGQSVYAAAGDNGAYQDQSAFPTLTIDDPGGQPYVTAVGGTSLAGTIGVAITETVWNGCPTPSTCGNGLGAGGGGVSAQWPLPTYQAGVSGTASHANRNTPDVALNADDVNSPYSIYVGGAWYQFGGTSAAAPLWAGFTALINESRGGLGNLGFANNYFYALGTAGSFDTLRDGNAAFNDITGGANGFFSALSGYDNASGWGSIQANAMIADLTGVGVVASPAQPANVAFTFVSTNSVSLGWTDVSGSSYTMVISTNANFSSVISSGTGLADQNATSYFMLTPATYYFQVKVSTNPDFSYSAAISTFVAGLPPPPPPANVQFTAVSSTSISIGWTDISGNSYLMVLSTNSNFSTTISSGVGGLNQNTTTYAVVPATYYFKVKISTNSDLSYSGVISTTAANLAGTGTSAVCDNGTVLSLTPIYGPITLTFPAGSCGPFANTVTATIPTVVPGFSQGQGGSITPLGPMVDITLTEPISQFYSPVVVQMTIPPTSVNPDLVKMAWFDPLLGQWFPELTASYNSGSRILTATIFHNSLHGAVVVQATANLGLTTVFPNPINFGTAVRGTIKFMGLTLNPTINIYDLAGQRVISMPPGTSTGATFNDGLSGTAEWDGHNTFGSPVARGTYIYVIRDAAGHTHSGKIGVTR